MDILKVKDLAPGKYQVLSYDARQSRYGRTFIISAIYEHNNNVTSSSMTDCAEEIRFWANGYLTNYLNEFQPKKKFNIQIKDNQVTIEGYNRKIVLM